MATQKLKSMIKDHFLSGMLILAPILIVAIVFQFIFGGVFRWIDDVPLRMIFGDERTGFAELVKLLLMFGLVLGGILIVSIIGLFSRLYLGIKLIQWMRELIEKIPFFGSIYSSVDQLMKAVSSSGGKQFNRVVFIEYPRKEVWAVAFVTGKASLKGIPAGYLSVYIPTVPNPTSGFHLMVKEADVVESGLKVDEAFKLILSLGVALPHE